jgi:hypothetical protein
MDKAARRIPPCRGRAEFGESVAARAFPLPGGWFSTERRRHGGVGRLAGGNRPSGSSTHRNRTPY